MQGDVVRMISQKMLRKETLVSEEQTKINSKKGESKVRAKPAKTRGNNKTSKSRQQQGQQTR